MKTADLQRSIRLVNLNWGGSGDPDAGEMIEWLLGKNLAVIITKTTVSVGKEMERLERFLIKDGNICNAIADACAWVLAKAIESQEIKP